jgi:tRNA G18 (ribose-2'-O)-methylase SpoU
MATLIPIEDPADPRVADYVGLKSPAERRRVESAAGIFVAEGPLVVERMLRSPYHVRSLMLSPQVAERMAAQLAALDLPVYVASRAVMSAVAAFDIHRGAVAVGERIIDPPIADLLGSARTVVVLEGLSDNENVGAIARSARALGVDAMLLDPRCNDPLYRRTVRVSMGEILFLPYSRVTQWPEDLQQVRAAGFEIVAFTPSKRAIKIARWKPADRKVALLFGAEGPGLSAEALAFADRQVRIPINPEVDSINVGHAAAIAFHHVNTARH